MVKCQSKTNPRSTTAHTSILYLVVAGPQVKNLAAPPINSEAVTSQSTDGAQHLRKGKQAQAERGSHPANVLEQVERWRELRFHTDPLEGISFRVALVVSSALQPLRAGAGYYQTP